MVKNNLKAVFVTIVLLCSGLASVVGQALPKYFKPLVEGAGLEYVEPKGADEYSIHHGKTYHFFEYDMKLIRGQQLVFVQIKTDDPHIGFAQQLHNLSTNAEEAELHISSVDLVAPRKRNAHMVLEASFKPRGFFHKNYGKMVTFYTNTGAVVTLVYMFDDKLVEDEILRVRPSQS